MRRKLCPVLLTIIILSAASATVSAQGSVPAGIHYQAVARNSMGEEIVNTDIEVRFSIRAGSPIGDIVYQEVFTDVTTSKYGVFSLIIGKGTYTTGSATSFGAIDWSTANHYLQVEVKFENLFMDMGTMQFMAVPYAMYAQQSLEPGPEGPKGDKGDKGDPGDPASDNQSLSVVNVEGSDYLAISGGNQVKISTIEHDGDPANELQDLRLTNDILYITQFTPATQVNLAPYNQSLTYNPATYALGITGQAASVDLSGLKNDNDANPANEIQTLTYNEASRALTISGTGGNTVSLGTEVAFRARNASSDPAPTMTNVTMAYDATDYNVGNGLNASSGVFTAPMDGIYTFDIGFLAEGTGSIREIAIYLNSALYEKLAIDLSQNNIVHRSVTMRLSATNYVSVVIYTGTATQTGTGSFSGFKVN